MGKGLKKVKHESLKYDSLLLLASLIWGTAFVAQRIGMEHITPFYFNGIRFLLGAMVLIPFIRFKTNSVVNPGPFWLGNPLQKEFVILGLLLTGGASLQQVGIVFTTAGKAGFITGLYVILVPICGILFNRKTSSSTWLGATMGIIGLYLLSIKQGFTIEKGDLLVLIGAFFWTFHVLAVDRFTKQFEPLLLAFWQFIMCGVISLVIAVFFEHITFPALLRATIPILYAGLLSVGTAYTLQVVAQKYAHPSHAAIILSLESPFAALAGYVILHEVLSSREMLGALLMVLGMIISQVFSARRSVDPAIGT